MVKVCLKRTSVKTTLRLYVVDHRLTNHTTVCSTLELHSTPCSFSQTPRPYLP